MKRETAMKAKEHLESKTNDLAVDSLWRIIQRYDHYIGTTNTKAAIAAAFNTFIFGTIVIKWQELLPLFGAHRSAAVLAGFLLAIAAIASLVSLWATFQVINPFLRSPKSPTQYHSVIFFSHVAEHENSENYLSCFQQSNSDTLCKDLGTQAHVLACGIRDKFQKMKIAVGAIILVQLPALAGIVVVKLWTLVADILVKGVAL